MANNKRDELVAAFVNDYPDTDLYVYSGRIRRPYEEEFISDFDGRPVKSKNLIVWMTTYGGDPNVAYRIGRCIQRSYGLLPRPKQGTTVPRTVSIFVDLICASAGTLVTFSGNNLIMTDLAELSPIDIQIRKPDDIERDSGLTPTQALDILERRSKSLFKAHFNQLRLDTELGLTTRTSVDVASSITTGLLSQIYGQIDPMRLGEVERLMGITAAYGDRLGLFNLKEDSLAKLLSGYPSHDFVIDRYEAEDLYKHVEAPKPSLRDLAEWWRPLIRSRLTTVNPVMFWMTSPAAAPAAPAAPTPGAPDAQGKTEEQNGEEQPTGAGREGASRARPRSGRTGAGGAREGGGDGTPARGKK